MTGEEAAERLDSALLPAGIGGGGEGAFAMLLPPPPWEESDERRLDDRHHSGVVMDESPKLCVCSCGV